MKIERVAKHSNYNCYFKDWKYLSNKKIRLYHTGCPLNY